ncbi:MAG: hypothetical protein ABIA92_01265 [Patescibacteria group bacterium]
MERTEIGGCEHRAAQLREIFGEHDIECRVIVEGGIVILRYNKNLRTDVFSVITQAITEEPQSAFRGTPRIVMEGGRLIG